MPKWSGSIWYIRIKESKSGSLTCSKHLKFSSIYKQSEITNLIIKVNYKDDKSIKSPIIRWNQNLKLFYWITKRKKYQSIEINWKIK